MAARAGPVLSAALLPLAATAGRVRGHERPQAARERRGAAGLAGAVSVRKAASRLLTSAD